MVVEDRNMYEFFRWFLIHFNLWRSCACVGSDNWVILLRARYKYNNVHYRVHNIPSVDHSARPVQSIFLLHFISWKSALINSSCVYLVLPNGLFHSVLPTKPCLTLSPVLSQCPPSFHTSWFNHPITFSQQYWSWSCPLCTLLHSPVSQFHSATNISLSTLFPSTLSLWSSFSIRKHILRPYTNRQYYVSVCINFCIFLIVKWKKICIGEIEMK